MGPVAKKKSELDEARARLYKDLDKLVAPGAGRLLSDQVYEPLERVSTGTVAGDWVTGGGVPYGRITELFGPPSGGKSALSMRILANIQKSGRQVALIDAERSFDAAWAEHLGLDVANVFLLNPENAEQAATAMLTYMQHGIQGIVVDSIPAMRTRAELEGKVGEAHVGEVPRLWSKSLPRIQPLADQTGCAIIMLNQVRANIGGSKFNAETTGGGFALKHAYTMRIELRRAGPIKNGEEEIGTQVRLKVVKNRGPFGRRMNTPFLYGVGFSQEFEILTMGLDNKTFSRSGSFYSYGDERMGQGRIEAYEWLCARPELIDKLRGEFLATMLPDQTADETEPESTE